MVEQLFETKPIKTKSQTEKESKWKKYRFQFPKGAKQ